MRYEGKSESIAFTVTPNDMYKKAMEIDAKRSTRRVLAWILKEVVSETKKKFVASRQNWCRRPRL